MYKVHCKDDETFRVTKIEEIYQRKGSQAPVEPEGGAVERIRIC